MPRFPLAGAGTTYAVATGTFSLVNNTNEQDVLVFAAANRLIDVELDLNLLTQINTIRLYEQIDGANYRQAAAWVYPNQFDASTTSLLISCAQKNALYRITMQASIAEGAARNVEYRYMTRV